MPARFHLDEHFPADIASELRRRGIDITTTVEAGMRGTSDREQLARAAAEGRVMVTCDSDFVALHQANVPHAGLIYWTAPNDAIGLVVQWLTLVAEVFEAEELVNRIEYLP